MLWSRLLFTLARLLLTALQAVVNPAAEIREHACSGDVGDGYKAFAGVLSNLNLGDCCEDRG